MLGAAGQDTVLQMIPHKGGVDEDNHLSLSAGHPFFDAAIILLAFWAASVYCWLMSSLSSTSSPYL